MGCSGSSQVTEPSPKLPEQPSLIQSLSLPQQQKLQQQSIKINQQKLVQATIKKKDVVDSGQFFMLGSLGQKEQVFAKVNLQSLSINKMSIPIGLKCYNFSSFIKLQKEEYFISGGINHDLTDITNKCYIYQPLSHSVKPMSSMKQARYTHSSIYVSEKKAVYILGGRYYGDDSEGILNSCQKYLVDQDKWVDLPSMSQKRCTCFTMLWNKKIYAFGGYTGPYQRSTIIQYLDQVQNEWRKLDLQLYRGLQGAIMLSSNPNQITIFGGLTNSGSTDSVVSINFNNKSIISRKKLNTQRSLYKGFNKQNRLYIFGGDQQFTCQVYHVDGKFSQIVNKQLPFQNDQFDSLGFSTQSIIVPYQQQDKVVNNQYSQNDQIVYIFGTTEEPFICQLNVSLPHAQFKPVPLALKLYAYQGGVLLNQNQLLLFGGIQNDSLSIITSDTFSFDLKTHSVNKLANMNQNRYAFTYQLTKNSQHKPQYIYCFGGATSNVQGKLVFLNSCQRYFIKQNKWELISPLPKKLISPMSLIYNKKIFVFGGTDSQNKKNTNIYSYQQKQNQWITLQTCLPFGIQGGSLIQVSNNQFYIFGGLLENGQSSGIWSFYLNEKVENKKKQLDVIFHEKGQMSEKKSQHKIYKPKNQEFYVIFGGNKEALSFYDKDLKEQKSDRLYNLKSMFMSVLEEFNTNSLKGYLILSSNQTH